MHSDHTVNECKDFTVIVQQDVGGGTSCEHLCCSVWLLARENVNECVFLLTTAHGDTNIVGRVFI